MSTDNSVKDILSGLHPALLNSAPALMTEMRQLRAKIWGMIGLLTLCKEQGLEVPEDIMTQLQRELNGRKCNRR